jgi:spermidine/putrescine transport system ATP-binding protein
MQPTLIVEEIIKKFGDFMAVNKVSFHVEDGRFFSILGPSGCGKTTLLRMIAGLTEPTEGTIKIRGQNMIGVSPNKRPVNLIFQNLALFPMMDVRENVAFGLKRRGEDKSTIKRKVDAILERVDLTGFGNKKIEQLSGGQKQRVAIARCLVLDPAVLLLDEPLGALDLKLREHMKVELKNLQAKVGTTFIYITHDQSEALVMSDKVAVMNKGIFEQIDTPENLYYHPASSFVAQFVGENNKFIGTLEKNASGDFFVVLEDGQKLGINAVSNLKPGERVELFVRPEALVINPQPGLKDINVLNAKVNSILFDGGNSRLLVTVGRSAKELSVALPQNGMHDAVKPKDEIRIGWNTAASVCFKGTGVKTYDEL